MMDREAPPTDETCTVCRQRPLAWRCGDCFHHRDTCTECVRNGHLQMPFHRVERWNGVCFVPGWLFQAGLSLNLGHEGGSCPCDLSTLAEDISSAPDTEWCPKNDKARPNPQDEDGWEDIPMLDSSWSTDGYGFPRFKKRNHVLIIDTSGAHPIPVTVCQCPGAAPVHVQFMSEGLFPATFKSVETAFTFRALDDLRVDNLECKTAVMNWWNRVKRITTPLQPDSVPVSYLSLCSHNII